MFRDAGYGSSKDAPAKGFGEIPPTGPVFSVRSHSIPNHIRVETVEGIVGELTRVRGNKVFQVVTPAG